MQAIIMAGGLGVRLRPVTDTIPKALVRVKDRPFLERIFDMLIGAGIDEFITIVGYKKEVIEDHFGPEYKGVKISYVVQKEQKGTAHAVSLAESLIKGDFLIVNADVLTSSENVRRLVKMDEFSSADGILMAKKVVDPWRYGVLMTSGKKIVDIIEKPKIEDEPGNLVNAGIYRFSKEFFDSINETKLSVRNEYELVESIRRYIAKGKVVEYTLAEGAFVHITDFDDLREANTMPDPMFPK